MTTLTSSPSVSPRAFAVPSSRSPASVYRTASSSSTGGSSSLSSARRRTSPLSAAPAPRSHSNAAPPPTTTTTTSGRSSAEVLSRSSVIESAATATSGSGSAGSATAPAAARRYRDFGTQYTPVEYPPTAYPTPAAKLTASKADATASSAKRKDPERSVIADGDVASDGDITMMSDEDTEETGNADKYRKSTTADGTMEDDARSSGDGTIGSSSSVGSAPAALLTTSVSMQSLVASSSSSPKKKLRSESSANLKVMPRDYMKCNVVELGLVIADMLVELIQINDQVPPKSGILTRFHSRAPPTISVRDYLERLIFHATLSPPILLAMVYYIDRLCALYSAFTITSLTVHRFLITAATVGAKGLSDSFWTNHTYARVGGVSTKELAMLELDFLVRLDWGIVPSAEVLEDYYRSLVARAEGYVLEEVDEKKKVVEEGGKGEENEKLQTSVDDKKT